MSRLLLAFLLLTLAGGTALAQPPDPLTSLWTPEELAASPEERRSRPRTPPGPSRIPPPDPARPATLLPPLPSALRGSIRRVRVPGPDKPLALTFDLCQTAGVVAGYDGEVVDALRRHDAAATFFASGAWLADHPLRARQLLADRRFELAGHGWTHRDHRALSPEQTRDELLFTQAQYERTRAELVADAAARGLPESALAHVPPSSRLFRFPFGFCNAAALTQTAEQGLPAIQWDVVTGDPDPRSDPARMARVVLERARPGSIVIAHANGNGHGTASMLELALPELRRRGFRFVTVSELLTLGAPESAAACYTERPGDHSPRTNQTSPSPPASLFPP